MEICIISDAFPTTDGKGGFFFVEQIVIQFAKKGHRCIVIAPINVATKFGINKPYGEYMEVRTINNGETITIYRPRYYARNLAFMGVSWLTYAPQCLIEKTIVAHNIHPDIFYCHFFKMAVPIWRYATKNKIPIFVATGESRISRIRKPCRSFTISTFRDSLAGVICVSTKNKKEAIALGYANESSCQVFPNGVDLSIFHAYNQKECRLDLQIPQDDFVLMCVGNFNERKGQNRIIKAIQLLNNPHIKLILAGRGEGIIDDSCLLYKGFIQHDDLPKWLSAANAYIIPTRLEGCCNSIIEAMACGLPIISTRGDFNQDILNQDNSILTDPDNITEISNAINELYHNRERLIKLSKNALSSAMALSIKERANRILNFINENR